MRKAITPVVSIILLIVMTVSAALMAYFWISNIQTDLQNTVGSSVSGSSMSDCSRIQIISARGDRITLQNMGCDTISNVTLLIDGVLTSYDLSAPIAPGESAIITFDALEAVTLHSWIVGLDNGVTTSYTSPAARNTPSGGFCEGLACDAVSCEESSCISPYIMFTDYIMGGNELFCPCCGDDGNSDNFYESVKMCSYGGVVYEADSLLVEDSLGDRTNYSIGKGVCELKGGVWFEGNGTFLANITGRTHNGPWDILAGDFNEDGNLDMITANNGGNSLSYMQGNGDGTFQDRVETSLGSSPWAVVSGDLNKDTHLDLVFSTDTSSGFSYVQGDGDGTFQSAFFVSTGSAPRGIALGDFNEDGNLDVVTANRGGGFSYVQGDGDGTFQPKVDKALYTRPGSAPNDVAIGDFNEDGHLDLFFVTQNTNGAYAYAEGYGNGSFKNHVTYDTTPDEPWEITVGDFNNDNHLDCVITFEDTAQYGYIEGNGDGTFDVLVTGSTGAGPWVIESGDFNNDGNLDFITANKDASTYSYVEGNGDGTFQVAVNTPLQSDVRSVNLGDMNNDGSLDIIGVNYDVAWPAPISLGSWSYVENNGVLGSNGTCCGDVVTSDTFSNATNSCTNGVFS